MHYHYFGKALFLLAAAASCDLIDDEPVSARDALAQSIDGRQFIDGQVTGRELVAGTSLGLSFHDGELSASAGCNSMAGVYTIVDGHLSISADGFGMTAKGCDDELHEQDDWFASFLLSQPAISLEEPHLTLAGDDVTVRFTDREVADPDRPLVDTPWELNGIIENGGIGFGDWPVTVLRFADDGTFAIEAGCPTVQGSYVVEDDTLTFSDVQTGTDACTDGHFGVDVATNVLSDGEVQFEIVAGNLTLTRGEQGLAFRDAD